MNSQFNIGDDVFNEELDLYGEVIAFDGITYMIKTPHPVIKDFPTSGCGFIKIRSKAEKVRSLYEKLSAVLVSLVAIAFGLNEYIESNIRIMRRQILGWF